MPNGFFGDQAIAFTPAAPNEVSHAPGDTIPIGIPAAGLQALISRADTLTGALSVMMLTLRSQTGGLGRHRRDAADRGRAEPTPRRPSTRSPKCSRGSFRPRWWRCEAASTRSTRRASTPPSVRCRHRRQGSQTLTGELQTASVAFNTLLVKVDSGDGSLSKLLNDPALYNDLRRVTTRVDSLLIDLMANPRKYLKFSVF